MTGATIYPKADRSQWFAARFPGDVMAHPNVLVLHTTEGSGWPGYDGGATAPTFTIKPGAGVRQHFPVNMSARALENRPGGVQTNTLNVVQVELVGTCQAGKPGLGLYWPGAGARDLAELVDLVQWLHAEWPIPLVSTPRPWLPYPRSYGTAGGQRMSFAEWNAFSGVCGHQHVPEQDHGDPGAFPIGLLLQLAAGRPGDFVDRGTAAPVTPTPAPAPAPTSQEDDVALDDADIAKIAQAVWTRFAIHTPDGGTEDLQTTLGDVLARLDRLEKR